MTGEVRWEARSERDASILVASGKLVILGGDGELVIAEASPGRYRELRRAKVHDKQCWTAPALAGGRLLVRNTPGELRCYDVRGGNR